MKKPSPKRPEVVSLGPGKVFAPMLPPPGPDPMLQSKRDLHAKVKAGKPVIRIGPFQDATRVLRGPLQGERSKP